VRLLGWTLVLAAMLPLFAPGNASAILPNTLISNQASASCTYQGQDLTVLSNIDSFLANPADAQGTITLYRYVGGAGDPFHVPVTQYSQSGNASGPFVSLAPPVAPGYPALDLTGAIPLQKARLFHGGEPVFIVVTDPYQNIRPNQAETVSIHITSTAGDTEILTLTETGPNTGVFAGYIQTASASGSAAAPYDGKLTVTDFSEITARYVDGGANSVILTAGAMVDPYGRLFDSVTGQPVNGATVTIVDATTGLPATVHGESGTTSFPSAVTSGGIASDSSRMKYIFPPGGFRFPVIGTGNYRIIVTAPAGYRAPSNVPDVKLQTLPGAPYALSPASRGNAFAVNPGPVIQVDIPLDPLSNGLWLIKDSAKSTAAVGDFVPFHLKVSNVSTEKAASGVVVTDTLPPGLRYLKGTLKIAGVAATDPALSASGSTLSISLGEIAAGDSRDIYYVTQVIPTARPGTISNRAEAAGTASGSAITSNIASASIKITEDFLSSRAIIMGSVSTGACGAAGTAIKGIRIYLEDGSSVVTDKNGMFHFEGIRPGTHVVQLDLDSLPDGYEAVPCEENSRFAGRSFSQFVDLRGGTMWRTDFRIGKKLPPRETTPAAVVSRHGDGIPAAATPRGEVGIEASVAAGEKDADLQARVKVGEAAVKELTATILIPEGLVYRNGSARVDGAPPEIDLNDNVVTFHLGDAPAGTIKELSLKADFSDGKSGERLLTARSSVSCTDASGARIRTPAAETVVMRVTDQERRRMPEFVLHSHFDSFSASLREEDRSEISNLAAKLKGLSVREILVAGHTDNKRIARRSRSTYRDNFELSKARASAVGRHLIELLSLPPSVLTVTGMGETAPVSGNRTAKRRALNRRVEIKIIADELIDRAKVSVVKKDAAVSTADPAPAAPTVAAADAPAVAAPEAAAPVLVEPTAASPADAAAPVVPVAEAAAADPAAPGPSDTAAKAAEGGDEHKSAEEEQVPQFTQAWIENAEAGREWAWPPEVYFPAITSTHLALKHAPGDKVEVSVNGDPILTVLLEKTLKHPNGTVAVSYWRGVPLKYGDNDIVATLTPAGNGETIRLVRKIHVSTGPVKAELIPEMSRLVADGKNPPVIALRLLDKDDSPVRAGVTGKFAVSAPYEVLKRVADNITHDNLDKEGTQYVIGKEGVALIRLQPTSRSGEAMVTLPLNERDEQYRVWLTPAQRDWILVGLAEGTVGYNAVAGHVESLKGEAEERLYDDGRVAFFAKGSVQGKWLLTAAYDSAKSNQTVGNGLFQTIDPNAYYTLYGDGSQQQYEASSTRKLFLKIERDRFYALFGDYDTGLTITELSRYSRTLNGVKSGYQGENLEFNVFGSETSQAFVKDEIQGDGTSGLYRLSKKNIVMNSEKVTLQTRDRFRSEIIVSTQNLSRFTDYTIDYDSGTLFFKAPVQSRDDKFNPVFIVVDYEAQNDGKESLTYGGRVGGKFLDQKVKTGVSYIHENRGTASGDLYGTDASWQISPATKLRGEYARTENDVSGTRTGAEAFLTELEHRSAAVNARLYYRELAQGFGLGQQNMGESGTRKVGVDLSYKLQEKLSITGQAYRMYNLGTGSIGDMVEGKAVYTAKEYSTYLGLRHANDRLADGSNHESEQVTMGASRLLFKKLNLRVDHDQSIGGNANASFPTRTALGADLKATEKTTISAQQEFTNGTGGSTSMTSIGIKTSPLEGTTLNSSMQRNMNENGDRLFALFGLKQLWKITDKWSVDVGLDRSQTLRKSTYYSLNTAVPAASGNSEDFTAVSLGTAYQEKKWNWNARVEARNSQSESKWGIQSSFVGEPREAWGWSARLQLYDSNMADGTLKVDSDLRLGLVYRPLNTRWIILDRLDLIYGEQSGGTTATTVSGTTTSGININNRRIVNNLNANFKPDAKTQVSLQYGAKYVLETIDGRDYSGYTDLIGIEGRYDVTKKWDVGLRGSVLHSWTGGQMSLGAGPSIGYNVMENAWVSFGYNFVGFYDKDFSAANYSAQGPFVQFRFKFDQKSVKDAAEWIAKQ
jgi:uncharacterized repeat protein (TIGR01451 family)